MGEFADYVKALWAHGPKSYRLATALKSVVALFAPALALFGVGSYLPALPPWAPTAWIVGYLVFSALVVWPYQAWRALHAELNKSIPGGHMTLADLIEQMVEIHPTATQEDIVREIHDWLASGELFTLGRLSPERPLVLMEQSFWMKANLDLHQMSAVHPHIVPEIKYTDMKVDRARANGLLARERKATRG
jgi:hypothetical protein